MTNSASTRALSFQAAYAALGHLAPAIIRDPGQPLVSIVTPSYNQGQFIRETMDSVLSQDYPNIEYWVIDGGSTDETLSVLKEYECDPRLHWISEKDKGQSDAINKGLARCRGQIFNWLGSDDLLLPGAFRHVVDAWLSLDQPAVLYGWARLIDQYGNDLGYGPRQRPNITLNKMLRSECFPMQQAAFVPTDCVRDLGGVDCSLSYAMDLDLWVRLIERLPFRHIPFDLALYRLQPASKTVSLSVQFIDDVGVVLDRAASRGLLSKTQAISYTHLFAAQVYLTPEATDLPSALERLAKSIRTDASTSPTALAILFKALARRVLGEKRWSLVRQARARLH